MERRNIFTDAPSSPEERLLLKEALVAINEKLPAEPAKVTGTKDLVRQMTRTIEFIQDEISEYQVELRNPISARNSAESRIKRGKLLELQRKLIGAEAKRTELQGFVNAYNKKLSEEHLSLAPELAIIRAKLESSISEVERLLKMPISLPIASPRGPKVFCLRLNA